MRQKHKVNIEKSALVVTFILSLSKPGYAYIDPGTVSIVVQALVAGAAAAAATFRYWINWVKGLFGFLKGSNKTKGSDKADEGQPK